MRILKVKVSGLKLFKENLEIDFTPQQRVRKDKNEMLFEITPKIRTHNVMAFIGVNASGKTTTLKVISFIIQLLNNESINNIESNEILKGLENNEKVVFETYFCCDSSTINKLITTIKLDDNSVVGDENYVIDDEIMWSKSIHSVNTIKNLFAFNDNDRIQKRDKNEEYLPDDVSIIIASNKKNGYKINYKDTIDWTNVNLVRILGDFPKELITFLDPSIEYLKANMSQEDKKLEIKLKFYSRNEIILYSPIELAKYLSSGTIKGINLFINAMRVLKKGGYLIVDELENHFNKEIVSTLVRFFMNQRVNKKGAVLIFTTHYPELLDEFERNDNIFIVRNIDGIHVDNLSNILTRSDIKKSDIYQSGYIDGTTPAYEAYIDLKNVIVNYGGDEWN